jgi:hypothetical protein
VGWAAGAVLAGGLAVLAVALFFPRAALSNFEFGLLYTITRYDQALPLAGLGLAIATLPLRFCIASLVVFVLGIPAGGLAAESIADAVGQSPWLISAVFLVPPVICAGVGIALVMPHSMSIALTPVAALLSGAALGLVISFKDPNAAQRSFALGAVLSGLWLIVPPLLLWRQFQRPWFPIVARIFGAWLIAIGSMLIASQLIPRPPPSESPPEASPVISSPHTTRREISSA